MTHCLSEEVIEQTQPGDKFKRLRDGDGLMLEVTPKGRKWWRLAYRWHGKKKHLALGNYPAVSLREARIRRDIARQKLRNRIEPHKTDWAPGASIEELNDTAVRIRAKNRIRRLARIDALLEAERIVERIAGSDCAPGDIILAELRRLRDDTHC
jgi:hypothetical protein